MKNKNIFPSFNSLKCKKTKYFLKIIAIAAGTILTMTNNTIAEIHFNR